MVQEGRDKTQTPYKQSGSTGTQHCKLRAHQIMQTDNTWETHSSWSAHTEMPSHRIWVSAWCPQRC